MNTTALAVIQPEELDTIQRTGKLLAASGYFDGKGDSVQAIAMMATKIMAGREMGFGPFASVNGVHIIKGKPCLGANLMAAAVKGNPRYDYRVREMTDKVCKIEFFQRNGNNLESLGISEFTKEDAARAETQNMHKFPRNMLFARAMSNGVKWFVPDIFSGNVVYVPEELGAEVDGDGNVVDTTYTMTQQDARQAPSPSPAIDSTSGDGNSTQRAPMQAVKDNPFDAATDDEIAIMSKWGNRTEAEMWAVSIGACANEFEAKNSLNKVVGQHGGKVTKENIAAIYLDYCRKQLGKLEQKVAA